MGIGVIEVIEVIVFPQVALEKAAGQCGPSFLTAENEIH